MVVIQTIRFLGIFLLVISSAFRCLLALKCYGKTNETFTRKCATFCSELNCPSYCICVNDNTEDNACSPMPVIPNNAIQVKETVTPGTTILSINASGSDRWELALQRSGVVDGSIWNDLSSYLKLNKIGNVYEIIVDQTPDLEDIFYRFSIKLKDLTLILTCKTATNSDEIHQIKLDILPVNEFAPEYREAILIQNVTEDTKVGSVVLMLVNQTMDLDVNPYGRELGVFGMANYLLDTKHDGKEYFAMKDLLLGSIVLLKTLDYESLKPLGGTRFFLNVSASDIHGLTTYTTLTINILDVDDLPPEFYFSGCPVVTIKVIPCHVSYEAVLPLNYVGRMTEILPSFIQARDMDTLNSPLEFTLELAPGEKIANLLHFTINKTSGEITVTAPFLQATEVRLVVVVREKSFMSKSTQASFHVLVDNSSLVLMPLKKVSLPELSLDPAHQSDTGRIYVIIFLVAVGVVIFTLLALVIYLCLRLKKLNTVSPGNSQANVDAENKRLLNNGAEDSPDGGGNVQSANSDLPDRPKANNPLVPPSISGYNREIEDKGAKAENSQIKKGLGQKATIQPIQPETLHLERVNLGVGNVNKSCFNDNESGTAIVTYYFNERQSAEFQQSHNVIGAHRVVSIEREELWGRRITPREIGEGACERIRVNSANIVLDMGLPSVSSLRRYSQRVKRKQDRCRPSGILYSESSTSVCSSSSSSPPVQCRSPCRQLTHRPYTPQCGYSRSLDKYPGDHCSKTKTYMKYLRQARNVQAESSQETPSAETSKTTSYQSLATDINTEQIRYQSLATDTNSELIRSEAQSDAKTFPMSQNPRTAQILSIMPLDQRSFICESDDSCSKLPHATIQRPHVFSSNSKVESPTQRNESKLQKIDVSSFLKLESHRKRQGSKLHRPSSLLVKSTSSRLIHESGLQRPSSSYPRSSLPRRRRDSLYNSPKTSKVLCVEKGKLPNFDSNEMTQVEEMYEGSQTEKGQHGELIQTVENILGIQGQQNQCVSQESNTRDAHSAKSKLRPHTCPSETHTAENFHVTLPNRPWTSEVSTGAHKKNITGLSGTHPRLVSRDVCVTKPHHVHQQSPSTAVLTATDLHKKSNTSVSHTHVTSRSASKVRPPRRLNKVKKKRGERHRSTDTRLARSGENTDEHGDSSKRGIDVRSPLASLHHLKMLGETDHREGCWPPDSESTNIPKVRRLPSLEQRPVEDLQWPNALSAQLQNEQMPMVPRSFPLENKTVLPQAEQVVINECEGLGNSSNNVADDDTQF